MKVIFNEAGWSWENDIKGCRTIEEFEELVRGIEELDPKSYSFRYPVNTKGLAALGNHTVVNPIAFSKNMDTILDWLDGVFLELGMGIEFSAEMLSKLQDIIDEIN